MSPVSLLPQQNSKSDRIAHVDPEDFSAGQEENLSQATVEGASAILSRKSWIRRHLDVRRWIRTILHLDDSPHSIALGTAIGLFIGITPTGGIQMALVLLVAVTTRWLFRFNRIAALLCVYVSNPVTTLPLYWYSYRVGTLFFTKSLSWGEFKQLILNQEMCNLWQAAKTLCFTVGLPILVGSIVIGAVVSVLSYPVIYVLTHRIQQARHQSA